MELKNEPKHNCSIECLSNSYSLLGSSSFSWYFELMKKPYLLIAGQGYYPSSGTGDWIGCYETSKEAEEQVKFVEYHTYYQKGKRQGEIKETFTTYEVNGEYGAMKCDWYDVVDLRDWVE